MKLLPSLTLFLCTLLVACGGSDESSAETPRIGEFVASSLPDDMKTKNTIFIFAPQHCPKEAGQRADALERALESQGLTVQRKNRFHYSATNLPQEEIDAMNKTMEILNGEVPIVFINEYGKANPSADEVLEIYEATQ
ncbi:MAG: hypothetical protein KGV50_05365 [Gammaproteobacteria bacterium]|nr:hypothetical protein [Gammaproteobacteria bacterium]